MQGQSRLRERHGPSKEGSRHRAATSEQYQTSEETGAASLQGISPSLHVGVSLGREAVEQTLRVPLLYFCSTALFLIKGQKKGSSCSIIAATRARMPNSSSRWARISWIDHLFGAGRTFK